MKVKQHFVKHLADGHVSCTPYLRYSTPAAGSHTRKSISLCRVSVSAGEAPIYSRPDDTEEISAYSQQEAPLITMGAPREGWGVKSHVCWVGEAEGASISKYVTNTKDRDSYYYFI